MGLLEKKCKGKDILENKKWPSVFVEVMMQVGEYISAELSGGCGRGGQLKDRHNSSRKTNKHRSQKCRRRRGFTETDTPAA